jgi:hypothetical protein
MNKYHLQKYSYKICFSCKAMDIKASTNPSSFIPTAPVCENALDRFLSKHNMYVSNIILRQKGMGQMKNNQIIN